MIIRDGSVLPHVVRTVGTFRLRRRLITMTAESIFERELTHWVVRGVVELAMTSPLQEPILEGVEAAGFGDQIQSADGDASGMVDGDASGSTDAGEEATASSIGVKNSSVSTDESTPSVGDSTEADSISDGHTEKNTWTKLRQGATVFVVMFVVLYLLLRWATKNEE